MAVSAAAVAVAVHAATIPALTSNPHRRDDQDGYYDIVVRLPYCRQVGTIENALNLRTCRHQVSDGPRPFVWDGAAVLTLYCIIGIICGMLVLVSLVAALGEPTR